MKFFFSTPKGRFLAQLLFCTQKFSTAAVLAGFICLSVACSSAPQFSSNKLGKHSASSQTEQSLPFDPLGNLLTQAETGLKEIEEKTEAEAVVRFAIFHKTALAQEQEIQSKLTETHFKLTNAALKSKKLNTLLISKLGERFQVLSVPTSADLPINFQALQAAFSRIKARIEDYQGLTLVSYRGQALKQGLQIKVNCQIAQALAQDSIIQDKKNLVMASLVSLEAFRLEEFTQRCADSNTPWVKPAAELIDEQSLRLVTRGLNHWGRPELELGPIQKAQAPQLFKTLIEAVEKLRTQPLQSLDQPLKEYQFTQCQRPEHHFEISCRRIKF